jgi:hypothetical protein
MLAIGTRLLLCNMISLAKTARAIVVHTVNGIRGLYGAVLVQVQAYQPELVLPPKPFPHPATCPRWGRR